MPAEEPARLADARSGPFAWSPLAGGDLGYLVAGYDGDTPVIDVVLVVDDNGPARSLTLGADDASRLAGQLFDLAGLPGRRTSWMLPDVYRDLEALDGSVRTWDAARAARPAGESLAPQVTDDAMSGLVALEQADALIRRLFDIRDSLAAELASTAGPAEPPAPGRATDRKLTTMGGVALAAGIAALFWLVIGFGAWILLR